MISQSSTTNQPQNKKKGYNPKIASVGVNHRNKIIQNWIMSKMILFNLVTTSKLSNALEGALYQSSGMRLTATSMPALTLGRWWTGSQTSFWCTTRVILWSSTTETNQCLYQHGVGVRLGSDGAIISRSVTSCAGMTAFLVVLFSGGREKSFHQLPAQEQASQKEEAYARATVVFTRAQQICFIMGPLDMQGLVGAATIIGCLKYGASFSGFDDQDDPAFLIRLKDEDLLESPDDSAFLQSLRFSCAKVNGVYPPLVLVEAYITEEDSAPKVRRLHLIVVDLHRRRRMADRVLRLLVDLQVDRCAEECLHTLPIPWKQNQEAYQLRYVFGYAMEGSDLPCYILWPTRTAEQSFWCIDAWKGDWVRLDKCAYMAPLGIEHFFDAFCDPQRPWGTAAILWASLPAVYQRMPIWRTCMSTFSCLRLGVFRLKGRHQLLSVKSIRTWLRERRV